MKHAIEVLQEEKRGLEKMLTPEGAPPTTAPAFEQSVRTKIANLDIAIVYLQGENIHKCPECGSTDTTEEVVDRTSNLFAIGDELIKYKTPAQTCNSCEFGWTDYRNEQAETMAMLRLLKTYVAKNTLLLMERTNKLRALLNDVLFNAKRFNRPDLVDQFTRELQLLEDSDV